ncbi:PilT/PilU family type 4a pilus ATPase [Patescibacteria group bacterium]|nr:PilT/PilU family type 4a pilus ATPase [Patescibacteria group bacterium]MBU1890986.1 PilT/PilU family type 4a pilus ATPase [Patescibacteria group bacterium]
MTFDELLKIAVNKEASDLHLVADMLPILRVDGELVEVQDSKALSGEDIKTMIFSVLDERRRETFERERELDISYEIKGLSRFRVNLHWEKDQVSVAARVISSITPSLEQLQMPPVVYELLRLKQGLILITGPTGCGKSTTLAAMIDLINAERRCNIVTLEDPIEFVYLPKKSIVRQRQLGSDMLSFTDALKHVVRQDPNVILVGEMRDLETIATTITLAETGHLVLATLHTYNAAQTVDRIIDVFPSNQQAQIRLQLSLFLKGIISQQLLPRIRAKKGVLGNDKIEPLTYGRVSSREVLINTPAIANLIRENKIPQIRSVIQTSADLGMHTMDQNIRRLYKEGFISRETALTYMQEPETLE